MPGIITPSLPLADWMPELPERLSELASDLASDFTSARAALFLAVFADCFRVAIV